MFVPFFTDCWDVGGSRNCNAVLLIFSKSKADAGHRGFLTVLQPQTGISYYRQLQIRVVKCTLKS